MRVQRVATGIAVLLLFALTIPNKKIWGSNDAPGENINSSSLTSSRTYTPAEFEQTLRDRLSGGLSQKFPYRMTADSQGRILVTDPIQSVVHVFDTTQRKRWKIEGDRQHRLRAPIYIAVDGNDNVYITELRESAISVFDASGRFLRTIGQGVLKVPRAICVDKQNERLYVADWLRKEILSFDLEGKPLEVMGSMGTRRSQVYRPVDIVVHGDTLVVLDAGNSRFELFDLDGNFRGIRPFGINGTPITFAFDAAANLYFIDRDSGGVVVMDRQGNVLGRFEPQRSIGQWVSRVSEPNFRCIAVDTAGNILVLRPTLDVEVLKLVPDTTG